MRCNGPSARAPRSMLAAPILAVSLAFVLAPAPAAAQSTMEAWGSGLVLNFSTPGARSLGLGGAFLGLADDATAAYANPAGLTLLPEMEVSAEARSWRFEHRFLDRGRLGRPEFDPTLFPLEGSVDTISGLRDGAASDEVVGLSFLSFVKPFRGGAVAIYHHTLADFEAGFQTQGAFFGPEISPSAVIQNVGIRAFPTRNRLDIRIRSLGIAAAFRVNDSLSVGLGLSRHELEIDNSTRRFAGGAPFGLGPPDFDFLINYQTERGSDSDHGATAGFLWTLPDERWRIGGVLRQGAEFAYVGRFFGSDDVQRSEQQASFKVPHQYGLGVSYRSSDRFTVAFDYYRIEYSRFTDGLIELVNPVPRNEVLPDFEAADGAELHLGAEYFFADAPRPFFLRAGVWSDPDHGLVYRGDDIFFNGVFPERGRVTHFAAGAGINARRYMVDFAIDYSERGSTGSLSTVVRF